MTEKKFKRLMIEYAMTCLYAESLSFCRYYQTDCMTVEYEMFKDHGIAYMVEKDGTRTEIADIYFQDVAKAVRDSLFYTEKPFNSLVGKYELKSPYEVTYVPLELLESEEPKCQEMN